MSEIETTVKAFLARLGWDLESSAKRVEDVLKNKKLSNTIVYLSKEVRALFYTPILMRTLSARQEVCNMNLKVNLNCLSIFVLVLIADRR